MKKQGISFAQSRYLNGVFLVALGPFLQTKTVELGISSASRRGQELSLTLETGQRADENWNIEWFV